MDEIVDHPDIIAIINASNWGVANAITHENRYEMIHHLVHEEVVTKRERNMHAFLRGLNVLELGDLIDTHPDEMVKLFQYQPQKCVTSEQFLGLIGSLKPASLSHQQAYEHFKLLLHHLEGTVY